MNVSHLLSDAQKRILTIIQELESQTGMPVTEIMFFIEPDGTRKVSMALDPLSPPLRPLLNPSCFVGPGAKTYLRNNRRVVS